MMRVQVAPFGIFCIDVYGAPLLNATPPLHETDHETSDA